MKKIITIILVITIVFSSQAIVFGYVSDGDNLESSHRYSQTELVWPTSSKRITSPYGWRIHPISGERKFHKGIDIGRISNSDPVWSADNGNVVYSGYNSSYGNVVLINSTCTTLNNLLQTRYAHLASRAVEEQYVKRSQKIGVMGTTGPSTGIHLHYETRDINTLATVWGGATMNPELVHSGLIADRSTARSIESGIPSLCNGELGLIKDDRFYSVEYLLRAENDKLYNNGIGKNDIEQVIEYMNKHSIKSGISGLDSLMKDLKI